MYQGHSSQYYGPTTYSQHGEDFLIIDWLRRHGFSTPSYLDVGAHHPTDISNTKLLYERGSSGVNVECNPILIELFNQERPRDKNICIGISNKTAILPFYMYDERGGRNTFSTSERDEWLREGHPVKMIMNIECLSINELLAQHLNNKWPDFLNIDAEGLDLDILIDANFTEENRPKLICAEIRKNKERFAKVAMDNHGYRMLTRMGENLIFTDLNYLG